MRSSATTWANGCTQPKTKGFARIRAQLQEENTPLDSEVKKEAEVVRQVRVNDVGLKSRSTSSSSPDLKPSLPSDIPVEGLEVSEGDSQVSTGVPEPSRERPPDERRGSSKREFLPHLYTAQTETPPPPLFHRPRSAWGQGEDVHMDSSLTTTPGSNAPTTTSATSDPKQEVETEPSAAFQPPTLPLAIDVSRKLKKRRREEDFDPASIKRRAVSPGMSVQSSPVLGQSPSSSTGGWWGQAKAHRENSVGTSTSEERSGSLSTTGLATPSLGPKRVGMQGYADTNDGLMKMTLE